MPPADLAEIEACYDAIPRVSATMEEVGPLTLFLAAADTGWHFYARPRLGLSATVTTRDVRRVLARQRGLGVPRAIEWVDEVTPTLHSAVREACPGVEVEVCPLLAAPVEGVVAAGSTGVAGTVGVVSVVSGPTRVLTPDDEDLPLVVGAVAAAFAGSDDVEAPTLHRHRRLIADGALVMVGAYDANGTVVGGGSAAPRGAAAELMGIAVVRRARRQGLCGAITRHLTRAVADRGVRTAYLSAASDDAAGVYRRVGFARAGTAMILGVDDE